MGFVLRERSNPRVLARARLSLKCEYPVSGCHGDVWPLTGGGAFLHPKGLSPVWSRGLDPGKRIASVKLKGTNPCGNEG